MKKFKRLLFVLAIILVAGVTYAFVTNSKTTTATSANVKFVPTTFKYNAGTGGVNNPLNYTLEDDDCDGTAAIVCKLVVVREIDIYTEAEAITEGDINLKGKPKTKAGSSLAGTINTALTNIPLVDPYTDPVTGNVVYLKD